jgi:hypothetical protein
MYCFHCGKSLSIIGDRLTCTAGQMPLSDKLQRELCDAYPPEGFPTVARPPVKAEWDARLFCPGCGVALDKMSCPRCSADLRRYLHTFVELHPHWYPGTKNWGVPLEVYDD